MQSFITLLRFIVVVGISIIFLTYVYFKYFKFEESSSYSKLDEGSQNTGSHVHDIPNTADKEANYIKGDSDINTTVVDLVPSVYYSDVQIMEAEPLHVIPKVFHFIKASNFISKMDVENVKLWRLYHPDWKIVLWSQNDITLFVSEVLGESSLQKLYSSISNTQAQVEVVRYIILYTIGGVCVDPNMTPTSSIEPVLSHHSCVFAQPSKLRTIIEAIDPHSYVSNFFMASSPGHPFWLHLLDQPPDVSAININPRVLTDSLQNYAELSPFSSRYGAVFVAPSLYFDPPPSSAKSYAHLLTVVKEISCSNVNFQERIDGYVSKICKAAMNGQLHLNYTSKCPHFFETPFMNSSDSQMFTIWDMDAYVSMGTISVAQSSSRDLVMVNNLTTLSESDHYVASLKFLSSEEKRLYEEQVQEAALKLRFLYGNPDFV